MKREIGYKLEQVKELRKKILEREKILSKIIDKKLKIFIQKENSNINEANKKASIFLEEYIGKEKYQELQKTGFFLFVANGIKYRIRKNGKLQEARGKYWYDCCVISQDLPLPDFIAAVFTAVKIDKHFQTQTFKTKTNQEVIK